MAEAEAEAALTAARKLTEKPEVQAEHTAETVEKEEPAESQGPIPLVWAWSLRAPAPAEAVPRMKEAQAAEAFGFPRFVRPDEGDVELTEEETNREEDFGYWCRPVRR